MKKLLIVAGLFFLLCQPVLAEELKGWGVTWWGMTEQKLLRVYKSEIANIEEASPLKQGQGYWKYFDKRINLQERNIAGLSMTVSFFLKDNNIIRTSIRVAKEEVSSSNFVNLKTLLTKKYGDPDSANSQSFSDWSVERYTWVKKSTTIKLNYMTGRRSGIVISYDPTPNLDEL